MPDVPVAFFSYSREDSEFALRLAEDLKAAGGNVWLDQLDIQPGQRWARAVEGALSDSPRLLVILSPASVASTNVADEVAYALEEHKIVIPVLYRDCKVPFQLRPFQYVDFRTDYDHGLKVMLKTLRAEQQDASAAAASAVPGQGQAMSAVLDQRAIEDAARLAEEERAREERERKATAEKTRLAQQERERQAAAEKARLAEEERLGEEQKRKRAAEKTRLDQEQRLRQSAAEHARLLEEERVREEQRRKPAAEEARLMGVERPQKKTERSYPSSAPSLSVSVLAPTLWRNILLSVVGVLVLVLAVYWMTRPPKQTSKPQKQEIKADPSSAEPASISSPQNAGSEPSVRLPKAAAQSKEPSAQASVFPKKKERNVSSLSTDGSAASAEPAREGKPLTPQRVRVSAGVSQGLLIHKVQPAYPPLARQARVQGVVVLQALIGRDGTIQNLHVVSGQPMLIDAALEAVKQWQYKTYYLNGNPVEVETTINVNFTLVGE